ncbi:xylan glycosyltransferase MUCI21-like [Nymphaea colorata]|nr:xylan glycosyltransferase MUCI21-like [Nymphaea colorata]
MVHLGRISLREWQKPKINVSSPVVPKGKLHKAAQTVAFLLLASSAAFSFLQLFSLPHAEPERKEPAGLLRTHITVNGKPLKASKEERLPLTSHCSSLIDGSEDSGETGFLCCDRSSYRSDVCYMKGDIRTSSSSSAVHLYHSGSLNLKEEKIRPYTRKWERNITETIDEIKLKPVRTSLNRRHSCHVKHQSPAVLFSTGGYTGNVYHEFNDGLIPLFLTAERFEGNVVFVILEYHNWWMNKYGPIIQRLTKHEIVDFAKDKRTHCFGELIVGLRIHDELSVNPGLTKSGKNIHDFQAVLAQAFRPPQNEPRQTLSRPRLTILTRKGSRVLLNLKSVSRIANKAGFDVETLSPKRNSDMGQIYRVLHSSQVLIGVHGAALTHFLFMRPGSVFIQIVPLGLNWAADAYYGEPARKLGLDYVEYRVRIGESSLSREYNATDPVLVRPESVNSKGWWETKRVYMDRQNVQVDTKRFRDLLARVYKRVVRKQELGSS